MTHNNSKISLTAVVVTYNRLAALKQTLAVYRQTEVDRLVVVDNASSDGTAAYLSEIKAELGERIVVLTQSENLGGAGGFHEGIRHVRDNDLSDWIVISDDDSFPAPDTLKRFKQRLAEGAYPGADLVSARVVFPDGAICAMNRPMVSPSPVKALSNLLTGGRPTQVDAEVLASQNPSPVLAASFVGLFVNVAALQQTRVLPNKDYFLYWDDVAFCLDMAAQGRPVIFDPALDFVHDCPRSSTQLSGIRLYYMVRNGYRTIAKMPLKLRCVAYPYKTINWLYQAIKTRSVSWYIKALKEV